MLFIESPQTSSNDCLLMAGSPSLLALAPVNEQFYLSYDSPSLFTLCFHIYLVLYVSIFSFHVLYTGVKRTTPAEAG